MLLVPESKNILMSSALTVHSKLSVAETNVIYLYKQYACLGNGAHFGFLPMCVERNTRLLKYVSVRAHMGLSLCVSQKLSPDLFR